MSFTEVSNNEDLGPNNSTDGRHQWKEEGEMIPTRIYVGNLSSDVNESELAEFFKSFGEVSHVRIIRAGQYGYGEGRGRNYGFVTFHQVEVVINLLESGEQLVLRGRKLLLGQAKQRYWSNYRCSRQGSRTEAVDKEPCVGEEGKKEEEVIADCSLTDGVEEAVVMDSQVTSYCDQECCRPLFYQPPSVYQGQQVIGVMPDGSWYYSLPTIAQSPLAVGTEATAYIPSGPSYYPTQSNQLIYPIYCYPEVQQVTDVYNNNIIYAPRQQNIVVPTPQQNNNNQNYSGFQDQVSEGNKDQVNSTGINVLQTEHNDTNGMKSMKDSNDGEKQDIYNPSQKPPPTGHNTSQPNSWHQYRYNNYNNRRSSYQVQYQTGKQYPDWGSSSVRKRRNVRGMAKPNQGRGDWSVKTKNVDSLQGQIDKIKL